MTYQELLKIAKQYEPVILLEKSFNHKARVVIKIFSFIVALASGLAWYASNNVNKANVVETAGWGAFSELAQLSDILLLLFSISLVVWLIAVALDGYYLSYYYAGTPTALKETSQSKIKLSYESAQLLLSDTASPTASLLYSPLGKEILIRAGVSIEKIDLLETSFDPNTIDWPNELFYDIVQIVKIISYHDKAFMNSLFKIGIQKDHIIGASEWITDKYNRLKNQKRFWGKESLGRLPGIGKELAYGYTYYLDQYAIPMEKTSEYYNINLKSPRHKKDAKEIEAILARGREANVLLVGQEGSGRIETVARVAKEIKSGKIFPELEHKHIFMLDGQSIISSSGDKGAFEEKLRLILNESVGAGNIILLIKDLHIVIRSALAVGSDFISLLEPYLNSRHIQVVATTNEQSYFNFIEKNPKIVQKFEKININNNDRTANIRLLLEYTDQIEYTYKLLFTYPSIVRLVDNAERYITSGTMPDKALDAVLEVASLARSKKYIKIITQSVIDNFFREKTNIPIGEIQQEERESLLNLEKLLHKRVIGQDEAVKSIANTMRRSRAGIQNPHRPMGSFLFLGPTGVGKTEVSKALASTYFGSEKKIMRFDMSEYKTADALDKLIGSFETGQIGTLVTALKKQPYGLILLDEFEKSTDQVKDLFLQILDEGKFSDMNGNLVNAESTIIIATSNAGADKIWELFMAGKNPIAFKQELINGMISEGIYKPELLNRFDNIVVFHPLDKNSLRQIATLMLSKLHQRILEAKGIDIKFEPSMIDFVSEKGANPQFGARPMNRFIQESIEKVIAEQIISQGLSVGDSVTLSPKDIV